MNELFKKYEHAKKVIHELQHQEHFLALQLQERDNEYNSHLGLLRDRVLQLENELTMELKGSKMNQGFQHAPGIPK